MRNQKEWFLVICYNDFHPDLPQDYVIATRRLFPTREMAQHYLEGVSPSRNPLLVKVDDYQIDTLRRDTSPPVSDKAPLIRQLAHMYGYEVILRKRVESDLAGVKGLPKALTTRSLPEED